VYAFIPARASWLPRSYCGRHASQRLCFLSAPGASPSQHRTPPGPAVHINTITQTESIRFCTGAGTILVAVHAIGYLVAEKARHIVHNCLPGSSAVDRDHRYLQVHRLHTQNATIVSDSHSWLFHYFPRQFKVVCTSIGTMPKCSRSGVYSRPAKEVATSNKIGAQCFTPYHEAHAPVDCISSAVRSALGMEMRNTTSTPSAARLLPPLAALAVSPLGRKRYCRPHASQCTFSSCSQ
jgi:hypothetical protein